jgi:hypothetical protein
VYKSAAMADIYALQFYRRFANEKIKLSIIVETLLKHL